MKIPSSLNVFGLFLITLVLVGAGCQIDTTPPDCRMTPWDSCISDDGVDSALTGQWVLESETISKNGQSFTTPLHGRITTFAHRQTTSADQESGFMDQRGTFSENFNTETGIDTNVTGIQTTCEVIGENTGAYFIDVTTDDPMFAGSSIPSANDLVLFITIEGGAQGLTCESGGSEIESGGTTIPLGHGFATSRGVAYHYEISPDWQTLTINNTNPVGILTKYIFKAQ